MKTISWITADYFIDVDLPVISKLKNSFRIFWQITIGRNISIDYENYVKMIIPDFGDNLVVNFVYEKYRRRNPMSLISDISVISRAKVYRPDIYYVSGFMAPWGLPMLKLLLPMKKVVMACHNVSTPKGATRSRLAEVNISFVLRNFINIQVFSKGQHKALDDRCSGKNVLEAPLALKDYGKPAKERDRAEKGLVRFLSFGIVRDYKRLDILIEAACLLYERGYSDFRVRIAGSCNDWTTRYEPLIRYPQIFELDIRRIPNEEVADLFAVSDYFVMPYQDIAQSGAITVAFQYNVPVIVSDIPQFHEFVQDGINGLFFANGDVSALAEKMLYVLENNDTLAPDLKRNQAEIVRKELSLDSIVEKYKAYLEKI